MSQPKYLPVPKITQAAWITKYLFTQGLYKVEGEIDPEMQSMLTVHTDRYRTHFHANEWCKTEEEAKQQALKMIKAKRASIQKQISKIDALEKALKAQS
jgi:hypothetical protein